MVTYPNAKINLGLRVYGVRPDGYHDIETVFCPIPSLKDILEIVPSHDEATHVTLYGLPLSAASGSQALGESDNLCYKAWKLLRDEFGSEGSNAVGPVDIYLYKNILAGAGLGGGSADAAFALKMLSKMFHLGLSDSDLAARASKLGSDCAFFIYDVPMLATGRGEILTKLGIDLEEKLKGCEIRIVTPQVHVSTAEAYRGVTPRTADGIEPEVALTEILAGPLESWRERLENDFEPSVFAAHPELADEKQRLYDEGAAFASMSGSGSSLFGIFHSLPA
jgi:4-diphosphocytidyl-2-C-methyl-D-erythritol kinase